ncbi:hypothetical protein FEM48_Zijuj03G0040700 [Ziziphus jujuba var. spinosa]|uniref:Uncharacterized protein n=1 Tax=Ziziphus jujuba var. spinosa TaxID=714518 RepID=A0A978VN27_ZIZJJ|nr:hypothetical protein FEM48_Zijuj03G0040700 [Ziziphus jujuba var. spinosa]
MEFKNLLSVLRKRFLATSATLSTIATTTNASPNPSFTVHFLVNSCGLPLEVAISASKTLKLDQNNTHNPESVLRFLKSHKFDDTQIANLISKSPSILRSRISTNLRPKFQFLVENGFDGERLPKLIMQNTFILRRSLGSHIKPTYEFLKKFLKTEERVVSSVKRASWLLTSDPAKLVPNMELLIREGVPDERVAHLLSSQPRTLMHKVERLVVCIKTVKELGLQPSSATFTEAVRIMVSMTESTWNKKMETFKELGWSEYDIIHAFIRCPLCLAYSEEKIRRAMDFYLKTMKLELEDIISSPMLLSFSKVPCSEGEVPNLLEMYNAVKTKAI